MHFSYQFGHFRRQLFKGFRHFGWLTLEADSLFRHSCGFHVFEYCMYAAIRKLRRQGAGQRSPQRRRPQCRLRVGGPRSPLPAARPQRRPLSATRAGRLSSRSRLAAGVCSPSPLLVYDDTPSRPSARGGDSRGRPAASALPPPRRTRSRLR